MSDLFARPRPHRIDNEDQAFALLEAALEGTLPESTSPLVDFAEWPTINIYPPETVEEGSISPSMMVAFIELQESIYRAHSLLTIGSGDLRLLNRAEKDRLEFRVKVSKGSSEYNTDLVKSLENIALSAVGKMTSGDVLIAVIVTALMLAGTVAFKAWLSNRVELRKAELESAEKREWLEAQRTSAEHETKRYQMLLQATQRLPILGDVEAVAENARVALVRAVGDEKGGTLQGVSLTERFAAEVTATKRRQSVPKTFTGIYRVSRVDTNVADGFRVTLTDVGSEEEITASLQDALVSEDHRQLIQQAEWSKRPIRVKLSARQLRARYIDAVVLSVEDVPASAALPSFLE